MSGAFCREIDDTLRASGRSAGAAVRQAIDACWGSGESGDLTLLEHIEGVERELGPSHWLAEAMNSRVGALVGAEAEPSEQADFFNAAMSRALAVRTAGGPTALSCDLFHTAAAGRGASLMGLAIWTTAYEGRVWRPIDRYAHAIALWDHAVDAGKRAASFGYPYYLAALRAAARAVPLPGMNESDRERLLRILTSAVPRSVDKGIATFERLHHAPAAALPPELIEAAAPLVARIDLASAALRVLPPARDLADRLAIFATFRDRLAACGTTGGGGGLPPAMTHDGCALAPTGLGLASLRTADLDGDGIDEIVVASKEGMSTWRVTAAGGVTRLGAWSGPSSSVMAVVDLDSDGQPEVVMSTDDGLIAVRLDERGAPDSGMRAEAPEGAAAAAGRLSLDERLSRPALVFASDKGEIEWWSETNSGLAPWRWDGAPCRAEHTRHLLPFRDAVGRELLVSVGAEIRALRVHDAKVAPTEVAVKHLAGSVVHDAFVEGRPAGGDRLWLATTDPSALVACSLTPEGWTEVERFTPENAPSGLCVTADGRRLYWYGTDFLLHRVALDRPTGERDDRGIPVVSGVGGELARVRGLSARPDLVAHAGSNVLGTFDEATFEDSRRHVAILERGWHSAVLPRAATPGDPIAVGFHRQRPGLCLARIAAGARPVESTDDVPLPAAPRALATIDLLGAGTDDVIVLTGQPSQLLVMRRTGEATFSVAQTVGLPDVGGELELVPSDLPSPDEIVLAAPREGVLVCVAKASGGRLGSPATSPIGGSVVAWTRWSSPTGPVFATVGPRADDTGFARIRLFGPDTDGTWRERGSVPLDWRTETIATLYRTGLPWAVVVSGPREGVVSVFPIEVDRLGPPRPLRCGVPVTRVCALDPDRSGDSRLLLVSHETQSATVLGLADDRVIAETTVSLFGHPIDVAWQVFASEVILLGLGSAVLGQPSAAIRAILHDYDGAFLSRTTMRAVPLPPSSSAAASRRSAAPPLPPARPAPPIEAPGVASAGPFWGWAGIVAAVLAVLAVVAWAVRPSRVSAVETTPPIVRVDSPITGSTPPESSARLQDGALYGWARILHFTFGRTTPRGAVAPYDSPAGSRSWSCLAAARPGTKEGRGAIASAWPKAPRVAGRVSSFCIRRAWRIARSVRVDLRPIAGRHLGCPHRLPAVPLLSQERHRRGG